MVVGRLFKSTMKIIIPRLDIKGPILVKGIHIEGLRVLGSPEKFAQNYFKNELTDRFTSLHLWGETPSGEWKLNHNVAGTGLRD